MSQSFSPYKYFSPINLQPKEAIPMLQETCSCVRDTARERNRSTGVDARGTRVSSKVVLCVVLESSKIYATDLAQIHPYYYTIEDTDNHHKR
jgi:hypothetical protein